MNFDKIAVHLNKVSATLTTNRYITALKDGLIINVVPSLVGSFFLLSVALPIPGYPEFMASIFGESWSKNLLLPLTATLDMIGIIATMGIAYRLAEIYKLPPFPPAIVAFMCYIILTPNFIYQNTELISGVFPAMFFGARGLFTAILVGIISTEIYTFITNKKLVITLPDSVPPAVATSFVAIVPGFISLSFFWVIRMLIDLSTYENIHTMITELITTPLTSVGVSFGGLLFYTALLNFLWFFGIHGGLVTGTVFGPIFSLVAEQNRLALLVGETPPHLFIGESFILYVNLGGSGTSLSIVIAMLLFAKSRLYKSVAKLSIIPGLFNINEPFVFGMPIVMNPRFMIPWIFCPIINYIIAYTATAIGLVPIHSGIIIPWTTPIIISGFLISGYQGVLLQIFNLCVSAVIWYFFFARVDKEEFELEQKT